MGQGKDGETTEKQEETVEESAKAADCCQQTSENELAAFVSASASRDAVLVAASDVFSHEGDEEDETVVELRRDPEVGAENTVDSSSLELAVLGQGVLGTMPSAESDSDSGVVEEEQADIDIERVTRHRCVLHCKVICREKVRKRTYIERNET